MTLINKIEVLSKEDLTRVHEASLKILQEIGVVFLSEEAIERFKHHGAKVNGNIVYLSPKMVEDALEKCPSQFKWRARNDTHSLIVGKGFHVHATQGLIYIQEGKFRRKCTLEDCVTAQKIYQASDAVSVVGGNPGDPADIDKRVKHLYFTYVALKHTDKPFFPYCTHTEGYVVSEVSQIMDMFEIAVGAKDYLKKNYCLANICGPISPLTYPADVLGVISEYVKRNQPIHLYSAPMAGITGPLSLFGTSVLVNAEILAGIVLIQLMNPGNPVVYTPMASVADMKRANANYASPEAMLINIANCQLGQALYHLPTRTLCGGNNAKTVNCQAGYETMQNMMLATLAGVHLFGLSLGCLDNWTTTSFEKLLIDIELFERMKRIVQGVDTSEKALSLDLIKEVGPGGSYLTHQDTLAHFRQIWMPGISDWESYATWKDAGSEDVMDRANRKCKEILDSSPESMIDEALDKELRQYISMVING